MHQWTIPAAATFICWGIWAFLPKLTTQYIDPKSAMIYEAAGGLVVALVVLLMLGLRPAADGRGILLAVLTGMLGILGALGYLFAVVRGPVTVIATVTALYPVLAIVLAYLFLNEPITLKQSLGICLGLVAIVLMSG